MTRQEQQSTPPIATMFQLIIGKWLTSAISSAARLGVADHLQSGPRSVEELSTQLKVQAGPLYRLLRALAGFGVFREEEERRFSQTPLSDLLRKDATPCMRNVAMLFGDPWHVQCWEQIDWCLETGQAAPFKVFGMSAFEYLSTHPEEAVDFNNAMTDISSLDGPAVAQSYDFSRFQHLVDVGGGMGFLLARILERTPNLKGTLFDMPYVIQRAREASILQGFSSRCTFVAGSFFESVPAADAYIMKHIVHDWDDEHATKLLKTCRASIATGGKLLVVDRVIGPPNVPDPGKLMDLEMLVAPGGLERDESEWRALFAKGGFRLDRVISTPAPQSILEGSPV